MDDPSVSSITLLSILRPLDPSAWSQLMWLGTGMLLCLGLSALCSSSENAFFSHKESDLEDLREDKSASARALLNLLEKPKQLLATILVLNSLANVAFVLLFLFFSQLLFNFQDNAWLQFAIEAVGVTLIILIFGEVVPKVYATQHYRQSARLLSLPMRAFQGMLWPLTSGLVKMGSLLEKRSKPQSSELTPEELSEAIDMTSTEADAEQEKEILKGIVNMGNIQAKQIMVSRLDMVALDESWAFDKVLETFREHGYSRMPVFRGSADQIIGILNAKHLLPHLDKPESFEWQSLCLDAFFIPENKPIDDLLAELRQKRTHLAIVVDEFGGTSGLITLEDILEEVLGEMDDEFDREEAQDMQRLNAYTYWLEGKVLLVDFIRECDLPLGIFDELELESDSVAGLLTEQLGRIPRRGDTLTIAGLVFLVTAADPRRVKKVKVTLPHEAPSTSSMASLIYALILALGLVACSGDESFVPKPKGYPRMFLPEKSFVEYRESGSPFECRIPAYAHMDFDTVHASRDPWYNLQFPGFNATLHLTYYRVSDWQLFDSLLFDSRRLVYKHLQRADDISELPVSQINPNLRGLVFDIVGNTATNLNFFVTDSSRNFVRGALYFNQHTNMDSIAPAYRFIRQDIDSLLASFRFKN